MRRQESMRDRERRRHRYADLKETDLRRSRNREDERDEQDEADFIKERDADDEAREADRPLDLLSSEHVNEGHRDALRTAALRHQLAEDRAERDDDGEAAERPAQPLLYHGNDLSDRQSLGVADQPGDDEQGDETVQLHTHDEEEQQQDAHS